MSSSDQRMRRAEIHQSVVPRKSLLRENRIHLDGSKSAKKYHHIRDPRMPVPSYSIILDALSRQCLPRTDPSGLFIDLARRTTRPAGTAICRSLPRISIHHLTEMPATLNDHLLSLSGPLMLCSCPPDRSTTRSNSTVTCMNCDPAVLHR